MHTWSISKRAALTAAWAAASLGLAPALAQTPQIPTFIHINTEQQTVMGVHLAAVQAAETAKISLPARVVVPTSQQAVVVAPAAGLVTRLLVTAGDTVKRGQLLAELSSPQIAQLQRQRNESAIQRNLARAQEQRDALLSQEGIIPAARLQSAQARLSEANEMLSERELALKLASGDAGLDGRARVLAPMSGIVAKATAVLGQRVDMVTPLFSITALGRLWLEIEATPQQAAVLRPGALVEVPSMQAHGVLEAKAPVLSAGQSVMLRVHITQPGALQPGGLVEARLNLPATKNMWRVPPNAVTQFGERNVVMVAAKDGFRIVPVQIASHLNDAMMIEGALKPGDKVAAAGVVAIKAAAAEVMP